MVKRGLVVEGGGMRGAHTCGVFMALKEMGRDHFDVVVASSAGAPTVSYFVSRQFHFFPSVWSDYLHDGTFLNLRNVFKRGRHILDIDYLVDDVFGRLVPLDQEAIRHSPTAFYITATDCVTGRAVYFDAKKYPILLLLKATTAMPFVYRSPVRIDGRRYIDGGIADAIPIQRAIDEGCDDILVVTTRPRGYRKRPSKFNFIFNMLYGNYPHLRWMILQRYRIYNETAARIEAMEKAGRVRVVRPQTPLPLTRLSSSQEKLKQAIDIGYRDAFRVLGGG